MTNATARNARPLPPLPSQAICTALPNPAPRETCVLLAVPSQTCEKVLSGWAENRDVQWDTVGSGLVALDLHGGALDQLVDELPNLFTGPEMEETRVLLQPETTELQPADLLRTETAAQFVDKVQGEWLVQLLREGGLDTAFQPIFDLKSGKPVAHECLMRGTIAGKQVSPGEMIGAARASGLLFHLDRAARITALRNASVRGVSTDVYVNINPASIYDPAASLRATARAAERAGIAHERIVFEVVESDRVENEVDLVRILSFYRAEGFRVALDDLGSGYSSLNLLTEIVPDVAKLDMALIRGIDADPVRQKVVSHLLSLARSIGAVSVVEGVETVAERDFCSEAGADLAQGYLFAAPALYPVRCDRRLAA